MPQAKHPELCLPAPSMTIYEYSFFEFCGIAHMKEENKCTMSNRWWEILPEILASASVTYFELTKIYKAYHI